jgi:hypothetical protein
VVFPRCTDAETLLACREAIALAKDLDARRTRVASDCKNVIKSLEEGAMGSYAHIVREIVEARADFVELMFCFKGRWTNKEAQNLAKSSL